VIVGAGAAGLATAIFTRRLNPSRSVVILDGAAKPGAKILVSGGTRCNVTNTIVTDADFWGGKSSIVRRILKAFSVADTIAFFETIGVRLREEANGKLFPTTNRARDVLDALLRETARVGAELHTGHRVLDISLEGDRFRVRTAGRDIRALRVVLATGGLSLPKTGSDGGGFDLARKLGHTIVATTPALVPITLGEPAIHRELAGVSHDVELTIWIDGAKSRSLTGSMLWTHTGISGPVALDASRHWMRAQIDNRDASLTANFWSGRSFERADTDLLDAGRNKPRSSPRAILSSRLPASLAEQLLQHLQIVQERPIAQLPRDERRRLAHALVEWRLPVTGTRGYNYAEVTGGGVALDEVDPGTLMSRVCPGLALVGEILDVDGRLGGFNFQWAWSSAQTAARALSRACYRKTDVEDSH
jgi:predicted Rossmann fold flavoprotein